MSRFVRENIENNIHIHKYSELNKFFVETFIANLIDFGPLILTILWTIFYLIARFNLYIYLIVQIPLIFFTFYFLYLYFIKYYKIKINKYDFPIEILSSPVKFVFVSDLHIANDKGGTNLKRTKILVEKINSLNPELVVFGGDFVALEYDMELLNELKKINAKKKIGVLGNHDSLYLKKRQQDEFPTEGLEKLLTLDIDFLCNEGKTINLNGQDIYFAGIDDLFSLSSNIDQAFESYKGNVPRILISHNPEIIKFITKEDNIDLVLSGHTHAGQILLPILGPVLPMPVSDRKLTKGIFEINGTKLFISQGAGYGGTRIRIGTECEICVIELESKVA